MAFDRSSLRPGEELTLDLRPHWWYLAPATLILLGAVIFGVLVLQVDFDPLRYLAIFVILGALGYWVSRFAKWFTSHFVLTSDRLIYLHGVVARSGTEIPLDKVNTVFFRQSIFERIFGLGSIKVESASETGSTNFDFIRKPSKVQNAIYHQIEANQHRDIDRMASAVGDAARQGTAEAQAPPPAAMSVPEQIEKLDELRARGVISEEEFQQKKSELLGRM
jgi:uncharacterized membrane protein YdbT with pleckstrin-like domain